MRFTFFTVTRLTEDGDAIPFPAAYWTEEEAIEAAFADAEQDGFDAVRLPELQRGNGLPSVTSARDEEGNFTEEWLITRVSLP